jgi:crossover junction endodeoxyribonuclease RuvC
VIVLGIDPGLANTGYGVVARRGGRLVALDGGVIETAASAAAERRLAEIHVAVEALIAEHEPDSVALEELYFGQNARSAFAVGQARGVVMLAAGQVGLPCAGYTPQQVKAAVCGSGRAGKDQVARMVAALLGLGEPPRADHAADALAVAVCHVNRAPLQAALAGAGQRAGASA